MHAAGNNTFHGIEQNEESVYSSKENDESDIESGNFIFILNVFIYNMSRKFQQSYIGAQTNCVPNFILVLFEFHTFKLCK